VSAVRRPSGITLLALAAASWALATVTTKVTLQELSPLDLLGIEVAVGAAAVWLAVVLRGGPAPAARRWRYARLGLLEPALTFALFDVGIDRTGAADAAVLVAAQSIFAVALSWLVLRERATARVGVAVALGFAGVVVVGSEGSGHGATVLGDVLVLASSAAAALTAVGARRIGTDGEADAVTVTAWQLLAAAIVGVPVLGVAALVGGSMLGAADPGHLLAAIATGLLGSAVPFLLYNTAIRELKVSVAAIILNLIPVFGAGLAVLLLGSRLSPTQLVGTAAIVVAAFGIDRDAGNEEATTRSARATSGVTDAGTGETKGQRACRGDDAARGSRWSDAPIHGRSHVRRRVARPPRGQA
jgi:drug/metabolite transporter (DMT)-like permease